MKSISESCLERTQKQKVFITSRLKAIQFIGQRKAFCKQRILRSSCERKETLGIDIFKGALSGLGQFLENETPLKMMKNAFYFTYRLFSFSRYLSFWLNFLVMYKSGLIRKIRLISKFMTPQPG